MSETMTMAKAVNAGLQAAMAADDRVLLMGEDIGTLGGVFRVTEGLKNEFGEDRVLDTPLAESGIVGTAIGLAMRGYRPVCEIQFDGFIFPAFDQITSQLAKMTARHEGALQLPVVIRVPYGGHIGAIEHHWESPEAYFAHTAGLRLVSPATPQDGFTMIQQAIANLVDNALKFSPEGGVVRLSAAVSSMVFVSVSDQGPGIALDEREKATDRFYRGESARSTPGSGLGLSLVLAVARLHGGELRLEDNRPGLRAVLALPLPEEEDGFGLRPRPRQESAPLSRVPADNGFPMKKTASEDAA